MSRDFDQSVYATVADPRIVAVLDVIAPVRHDVGFNGERSPVFEFGHETTPTPEELVEMATEIVMSINRVILGEHGPGGSHAEAGCGCPDCRPDLHC